MYDHMHGDLARPAPEPPHSRRRGHAVMWSVTGAAVVVAVGAVLYATGLIPGLHPGPAPAPPKPAAPAAPAAPGDDTFTLTGTITVHGQPLTDWTFVTQDSGASTCEGTGGYSDMNPGTAVTVADSTGHTVATGSLGEGTVVVDQATAPEGECVLPISVPDVPRGLQEYVLSVSHRGSRVLTEQEALETVQLSLGS